MIKRQHSTTALRTLAPAVCLVAQLEAALASESSEPGSSQVAWSLDYVGDSVSNVRGGASTGHAYLNDVHARMDWVPATPWGWPSRVAASLRYNNGQSISGVVGDLQGVSGIEAPEGVRVHDLWAEFQFAAERVQMRLGLQDLNDHLNVIDSAGTFINGAFGLSPEIGLSGANGPSTFPVTGLAATLRWELANSMALVAAIADGVPGERAMPSQTGFDLSKEDGALLAVELSAHSRIGRIAAGVWSYTAQFTEISQSTPSRGNGGHYVLFESAEIESFAQSRARLFARAGRPTTGSTRLQPILPSGSASHLRGVTGSTARWHSAQRVQDSVIDIAARRSPPAHPRRAANRSSSSRISIR